MSQSRVKAIGPRAEESAVRFKVYGVMAMTALLTFATLTTGYQMLFSQSVFA
jgi:intracellular septation protein A